MLNAQALNLKPVVKPGPSKGPVHQVPPHGCLTPQKLEKIKSLGGDEWAPEGKGKVVAKIQLPKEGAQPSPEQVAALKAKIEANHAQGGRPTQLPNFDAMAKLKEGASEAQGLWGRVQDFFGF